MHKVIEEWKVGVRDCIILTLNEKIPDEFHKKIRINGKEYEVNLTHFSGGAEEDMLDAMLRNIAVKTSEVGFIGKEVEFV